MDNTVVHGSQVKIFWKHAAAPGIPAQVSAPPIWSLSSQNDARFRPPVSAARHLVLRQRRCVHSPQSSLELNKTCLHLSLNEQYNYNYSACSHCTLRIDTLKGACCAFPYFMSHMYRYSVGCSHQSRSKYQRMTSAWATFVPEISQYKKRKCDGNSTAQFSHRCS